jgi:hypothetical protein
MWPACTPWFTRPNIAAAMTVRRTRTVPNASTPDWVSWPLESGIDAIDSEEHAVAKIMDQVSRTRSDTKIFEPTVGEWAPRCHVAGGPLRRVVLANASCKLHNRIRTLQLRRDDMPMATASEAELCAQPGGDLADRLAGDTSASLTSRPPTYPAITQQQHSQTRSAASRSDPESRSSPVHGTTQPSTGCPKAPRQRSGTKTDQSDTALIVSMWSRTERERRGSSDPLFLSGAKGNRTPSRTCVNRL